MLLALDIGNSAVKGGFFEGDKLRRVFSVEPTDGASPDASPDHWRDALAPHLADTPINQVGLVSVVPSRTRAVEEALRILTERPLTTVGPDSDLPFVLDYDTPDTLGVDRLAAAAAGWVRFGQDAPQSVLVVDAGTAINYEVVHRDGVYRGGAIGAGPVLVRDGLRAGTAQLPRVPLTLPESPSGQSTRTALQSGIMWGLVDHVRGMTERLASSLPDTPQIVLSGGWGPLLADELQSIDHHDPHLVLHGVRILTRRSVQHD